MVQTLRAALLCFALTACQKLTVVAPPTPVVQTPDIAVTPPKPAQIDLVSAPATGPVAAYVQAEAVRAQADGRRLLVYVGATWCEPCQRFHNAAKAGALDDEFANLRLLEFDLDRDADRLAADGYHSQLIPLLALPGPDGKGNGRGMQGSIKGEGAVAQMRPRLREVLNAP